MVVMMMYLIKLLRNSSRYVGACIIYNWERSCPFSKDHKVNRTLKGNFMGPSTNDELDFIMSNPSPIDIYISLRS